MMALIVKYRVRLDRMNNFFFLYEELVEWVIFFTLSAIKPQIYPCLVFTSHSTYKSVLFKSVLCGYIDL
jgi:hypothetical protein